jgi:UDP-glucose 4-epimerase
MDCASRSGVIGEIHNSKTRLIPLASKAALGTSLPPTVFGKNREILDGTLHSRFIHGSDLANAHVKALLGL